MGRLRRGPEKGMVTAELAAVLPVVVFILGVLLNTVVIGIDQIRCVDAARTAARVAARGESAASARTAGSKVAPHGARISVRVTGGRVSATVRASVPGPFGWLLDGHRLGAQATGRMEQP